MKNEYLPFDNESLSYDAFDRIRSSAREKAGLGERTMIEMDKTTKRKTGKKIIIAIAAAALMMPAAAGAYALGSRTEMFKEYIKGDTTSFDTQLEASVMSESNDDIILSIDGIAADELACRMLVTVEAKTQKGKEIIEGLNHPDKEKYPGFNQMMFTQDTPAPWQNEEDFRNYGSFDSNFYFYPDMNTDTTFHQMFELDMKQVDLSKPFILTEQESGVSMEFDIAPYLESYHLYPDEDSLEVCHYVLVSPLGVHIRSTTEDISHDSFYVYLHKNGDDPEIFVNYADGTSTKLEYITGGYGDKEDITAFDGVTFTGTEIDAALYDSESGTPCFIDLTDMVSVSINGVEYKK